MALFLQYPQASAGVPIYSTFSIFPAGNVPGALAVAADTGVLYEWNGSAWQTIGGPGTVFSIGTIDSQTPSANGAVIHSGALVMQSASGTVPGLVNTTAQTFAGLKTFTNGIYYKNPDTGGVARTVSAWIGDQYLSVKDFGATGNGSTDDTAAIQAAITAAHAAGGGVVLVPEGTYVINSTLNMAVGVTLQGVGPQASVFTCNMTGNAILMSSPINSSTSVYTNVKDLGLNCTVGGSSTGAGYCDVGGTYVVLQNVYFNGFKYGVIFDQTEIAEIDLCKFYSQNTGSIWLVNGADHTLGANQGYTNRISITRNQIYPNGIGIIDDGGNEHSFRDNNFNAGTNWMRCAGQYNALITCNEMEISTSTGITFFSTSLAGTTVGQCSSTAIANNYIHPTNGQAAIAYNSGQNMVVFGNTFQPTSVTKITGMANVAGFTSYGNTDLGGGGALYDGNAASNSQILDASWGNVTFNGVFRLNGGTYNGTDSGLNFAAGYNSPTRGRLFIGDGSGWNFYISKYASSTIGDLYTFADSGNFTATGTVAGSNITSGGHASADLAKANNLSDVASATTSFNNISPMTTLGDIIYGAASGAGTRLAGSTSATLAVLTQAGTGSASAAPVWTSTTGTGNVVRATSPTVASPTFTGASTFPGSTSIDGSGNELVGGYFAVQGGTPSVLATGLSFAAGYTSPTRGRMFIGDGTGWNFYISKNLNGSVTDLYTFTDAGALTATSFTGNGSALTSLNASNISSGTLPAAQLPNPSASTLGGIRSYASVSHQWINAISTSGVPSSTQPAASDLSNGTTGSGGGVVLATSPSIASATMTGTTTFPGTSSIDGSGNEILGGTLTVNGTGASSIAGSLLVSKGDSPNTVGHLMKTIAKTSASSATTVSFSGATLTATGFGATSYDTSAIIRVNFYASDSGGTNIGLGSGNAWFVVSGSNVVFAGMLGSVTLTSVLGTQTPTVTAAASGNNLVFTFSGGTLGAGSAIAVMIQQ